MNEGPNFSIPARPKEFIPATPGPADYSPEINKVLFSASKFSVGHDQRVMTLPANTHPVAPGTHEAKSSFGIGPKFSMS